MKGEYGSFVKRGLSAGLVCLCLKDTMGLTAFPASFLLLFRIREAGREINTQDFLKEKGFNLPRFLF